MQAHDTDVPQVSPLKTILHRIEVPDETGAQHNPSVCVMDNELRVVVRVLNDRNTTNYVASVSRDWSLREISRVDSSLFGQGNLRGFTQVEDLRLIHWQDHLWALAAVHDGRPTAIRQALVEIDKTGTAIVAAHVQHSVRHEKNWMPFVDEGCLRLVYSTDPLIVSTIDGAYRAVPGAPLTHQSLGHVRGGSQLVPWYGGWLGIVHQVYRPLLVTPGHNRMLSDFWIAPSPSPVSGHAKVVYIHRFALFDRAFTEVALGAPWYWKIPGIEFCAGLAKWHDRLVAGFGVVDKEAWLAEIEDETVWATFPDPEGL